MYCVFADLVKSQFLLNVDVSHAYAHARTQRAQSSDCVSLDRAVCLKLWSVQSRPGPPNSLLRVDLAVAPSLLLLVTCQGCMGRFIVGCCGVLCFCLVGFAKFAMIPLFASNVAGLSL